MATWKKILLGLLVLIIIAGILLYPKYKMLNHTIHLFDEDRIVENFRSFDAIWPISNMTASNQPYKYPIGNKVNLPQNFQFGAKTYDTEQFLKDSWTTGFLVIQDDSIVYENYYLDNTESTRNISWSMAKSFISALFGIAMEENYISDVMKPVEFYVPELKGTAYGDVRIKDVLQMSTGVKFNEDYGDFNSDINRWGRGFAMGGSQDEFASTLEREVEPGTVNHYVSINTHVLGMILTKATGRSVTDYMQEKLWEPLGMEHDGYWLVDGEGMEMVLGGLNATLRDYAKIGSLFMHSGNWRGKQLIPEPWVRASLNPDAPHLLPGEDFGYGYQWWIPKSDQGEFTAVGIYNQNIYINPTSKTVIVKLSANPKYNDVDYVPAKDQAALEMYREIVNTLTAEKILLPAMTE